MPMNESLNDLAVSTLSEVMSARRVSSGQNDFGEVTGFCDEIDQIEDDLTTALRAIRVRASRLKHRVQKHCESKAGNEPR